MRYGVGKGLPHGIAAVIGVECYMRVANSSSMEGSMGDRIGDEEWRILGNMNKATARSACGGLRDKVMNFRNGPLL
jgi:hypothetical protein